LASDTFIAAFLVVNVPLSDKQYSSDIQSVMTVTTRKRQQQQPDEIHNVQGGS
jgi:hypothetical protein